MCKFLTGQSWVNLRIINKNITEDLEEKGKIELNETVKILDVLEKVYNGEEPDAILSTMNLSNPYGETPELLIKAYKWIWGAGRLQLPGWKR